MQELSINYPEQWKSVNSRAGNLFTSAENTVGVIRLTNADGHLIQFDDGEWGISAEGYRACNLVAGISTITPDTIHLADGREVSNPYIEFDPETGTADKFWSQKITIGMSPSGKPIVSSATVLFDIRVRFVKELMQKIEENRDAGKLCMEGTLTEEEIRSGIFMAFQGKLGVYGRHDNIDVIRVIQNLINNKEHGDKIVQTLAWKSSIKQQPSMPLAKLKAYNGVADVLVIGYKDTFDETKLNEIAAEFQQTGSVAGAEVIEETINASEESIETEDSFLSTKGGPRF
ncbi:MULTISPECIES: hypothetical protein [Paenibacillus]|uniref:hypothetical protein n=1 Tax=Paenibacillus TaxID=44249 RepID=UPI00096CF294|nr:hypothetical protein [Paenibacillus odorifer]OMD87780.1 hypothetical protein BSK53_01980 [Paenibacillus odorifer]